MFREHVSGGRRDRHGDIERGISGRNVEVDEPIGGDDPGTIIRRPGRGTRPDDRGGRRRLGEPGDERPRSRSK